MEEFYEEIGKDLASFYTLNQGKYFGSPIKVDEDIIVIPINRINIINGNGVSEFHKKDKNLSYEIIQDVYPYSALIGGASIKPIAVLVINKNKTQLIKIDDDTVYDKALDLLKTLIKKTMKKK